MSRQCRGMAGLLIPTKTAGKIAGCFDQGLPVYSTVFYPNFVLKMSLPNMDINLKIFFLQKFSSCSARCHCLHLVTIAIKSLNFQKKKKKKKKKKPAKRFIFSATLNWSLSCRHASWDFTEKKSPQCRGYLQGFYRKEVPAVQGLYLGFANGKVNIPAISWPQGGRGCK